MSKRNEWSERLEHVLGDGDALQAFMRWMRNDTTTSEHPINLHFAIIAYRSMLAKDDKRSPRLARDLYNKFISLEGGLCNFLPEAERIQIGKRIEQMRTPYKDLFEPIMSYIDSFLRSQHALFVRSDEFLDMFNCDQEPSTSSACMPPPAHPPRPTRSKKTTESSGPTLTAELLKKSQQARESTLGESAVEKMYPPANKYPYVCMATTSKHDSAVSSSFSSDANGQKKPLKVFREEQIRGNPTTHTLARVEKHHDPNTSGPQHHTPEGRRAFARLLCDKLNLLLSIQRHDAQLAQIEKSSMTARDVVANWQSDKETAKIEEDDDVEKYVRNRMANDSTSLDSPMIHPIRSRRRSPKSTSPERSFGYNLTQPVMSTSAYNSSPYASNGFAPPPTTNKSGRNQFYNFEMAKGGGYQRPDDYQYFTSSTSGIGSMVHSSVSGKDQQQRAAMFQKARELSSSAGRRRNDVSSLPRQKDRSSVTYVTLSYREKSGEAPLIAKVPFKNVITFKEFRKHLSVSRSKRQFFFRTKCEDGSAPYQLLLISDDAATVPVFEGRITAEGRTLSDSD